MADVLTKEEDLIQQMLDRLRYAGAVDEPGYLGGARTTYNPFAGLGAATANVNAPSPYAQRALDIQAEMAAAGNATWHGNQSKVPVRSVFSNPTGQVGTNLDTPFRNPVSTVQHRANPNASIYESRLNLPVSKQTYATGHTVIPADKTAGIRYGSVQQFDPTLTSIDNPAVQNQIMDARLEGENISLSEAEKRAGVAPTKRNVSEIAAASETPEDVERRLAKEKTQALSTRKGTGLVKSLGPVLGTGLAVALAPDEAWALDKPALDYWSGAATGLDFGKFREDYSAALSDDAKQQWQDSMDFYGGLAGDASQLVSDVLGTQAVQPGEPDYGMGGGVMPFEGARLDTRAGRDLPQGYNIPEQQALAAASAYPSMRNVYTDPTAMAYEGITPPGEEFGSSYAGPNTMNAQTDYDRVKAMFGSPVDFTKIAMSDEIGTGQRAFNDPMGYPTSDSYGVSQGYGDFSPMMGMLTDMVSAEDPTDLSTVTDDPNRAYVSGDEFQERMPAREMGPQEIAQFTQPYYENIALDVPDSRFDVTVPDPISLGKSYGAVPTGYDARSWDDRFPTIAPDFSSGDFDLGSIEALKAAPFGQIQPVSYYDTYAAAPTVEDFTAAVQIPNVLSAAFGQDKTIANTGLINALAARDFFDSPLGEQKGHLKGTTFGPSLEQMDIMSAQDWIENINNVRPSNLDVQYTGGVPTKAVIDEEYFSPFDLQTTINPTVPSVGAGYSTVTHPAMQNVDYSAALASPDISAQAMIDDYTAARIEEDMSSYPQFASTQETVQLPAAPVSAPVSAPMAPRQQAMPAAVTPAPAPVPTVTPPAPQPSGPSAAEIERQRQDAINARLAQEASARQQQQAQQDMVRRANRIMRSKDYMDAGIGGLTGAQLDVLAAANIDTFGSSGGVRNTRGEVGMDETGYTDTSGYGVG